MGRSLAALVGFSLILKVYGLQFPKVQQIESEIAQLPKLFHLDDYDKCLARQDGLYCAGQFQMYSDDEDNPTYTLIKKYSQDRNLYNRTYLHHAYCLPTRCPGAGSNATARFEACVDKWTRHRHGLRARLHTLIYCQTPGQPPSNAPDTQDLAHQVFLYVIYFLVFMNIVGTIYDMVTEEDGNPSGHKYHNMLCLWSIRRNWQKLNKMTASNEESDKFAAIDGSRFTMVTGAVFSHVVMLTNKAYQREPRVIEKLFQSPKGAMMGALTTVTQGFIFISNFFTTYKLMQAFKKHPIEFSMIPTIFLKRIIRLLPLYLLLNGFAATWWASMGQGPMWPIIVGQESNICRRKFWATAGFLQNFFLPEKTCLVQTWVIAVDIQIHLFTLIIVTCMIKYRRWALHIISAMFLGAVGLTAYISIKNSYLSFYHFTTPDDLRIMFDGNDSINYFFLSPVSSAIGAVTGIFMGYVNFEMHERNVQKRFIWLSNVPVFLVLTTAYFTYPLKHWNTEPWKNSALLSVERLFYAFMGTLFYYGLESENLIFKIFRWSVLRSLARISMAVSMAHWCINSVLVATRTSLHDTSINSMLVDTIATWVLSHLVAVPLTIMVELPMQSSMDRILSYLIRIIKT